MDVSIVIPNYNGKKLFEEVLPLNMPIFKENNITDIVIVDDKSTDDSIHFLKNNYPEIRVLENIKNLGFSKSANKAVLAAKCSYVLLLNSDMIIHRLNAKALSDILVDESVFAVTPYVFRTDRKDKNESITMGYFKSGWLSTENADFKGMKIDIKEKMPLLWCCGGALFVKKEKFEQLNGFAEIFSPFYFEDVDLSYRAWKRGWKCVYSNYAEIEHFHQSSIASSHKKRKIERIIRRNQYIFMWRNLTDKDYLFSHGITLVSRLLTLQFRHIRAMIEAFIKFPEIIRYRKNAVSVRSDREILDLFHIN